MKILRIYFLILMLIGSVFWFGCSDESESPEAPPAPVTGTISVLVIDEGLKQPVEDVTITVTPGNIVLKTDSDGLAVFEVPVGDYFVDATVCCVGPGGIEYHVPVTVEEGTTARVRMQACLLCR
jgi:hypothetical protein